MKIALRQTVYFKPQSYTIRDQGTNGVDIGLECIFPRSWLRIFKCTAFFSSEKFIVNETCGSGGKIRVYMHNDEPEQRWVDSTMICDATTSEGFSLGDEVIFDGTKKAVILAFDENTALLAREEKENVWTHLYNLKKAEPKIEEKKAEPKVEEKKAEPKVEEKKAEPKVEEKKAEPKAEAEKKKDWEAWLDDLLGAALKSQWKEIHLSAKYGENGTQASLTLDDTDTEPRFKEFLEHFMAICDLYASNAPVHLSFDVQGKWTIKSEFTYQEKEEDEKEEEEGEEE